MEAVEAAGSGWAREAEGMVCGLLGLVELETSRGRTGPRDVWALVEQLRRLSVAPSRRFAERAMQVRPARPGWLARFGQAAPRVRCGRGQGIACNRV